MALLLFYVCLALGIFFLCSIMEAVLLSVTPAYIENKNQAGSAAGRRLSGFKDNIDRPLAATLSLNTIAHTVGAVGAGAQAAMVFGKAYVGIASAVLTLLVLILSEIILIMKKIYQAMSSKMKYYYALLEIKVQPNYLRLNASFSPFPKMNR